MIGRAPGPRPNGTEGLGGRLSASILWQCLAAGIAAVAVMWVADVAWASGAAGGGRVLAQFPELDPVSSRALFPPALILIFGALLLPLLPEFVRAPFAVAAPAATLWYILTRPVVGAVVTIDTMDLTLHVMRVDKLSIVFGLIFATVGIIGGVYAWHVKDRVQQVAAMLYNAGALGVTFAGDYFTLYSFWELMAVASTLLIWARREPASDAAGKRYIIAHLTGGTVLLAGILLHVHSSGSILFDHFDPGSGGVGAWLILFGFAVNAAIPPLGPWLPDAYPRATITGAVFCSALTTKTAVYALIRGFYGWEILIVAGVIMALYGVVYAVLANDIRELLGYHIISQVGYMVAGTGIGTTLAVNGATAHAVCHILYKSVLFMGAGVVMQTTGRSKMTELGGFWRKQKWVLGLYMIGAFSISGFPLFNGFVSKSMVTAAAHATHLDWVFLLLMLASVGTFLHTGLKLPYGVWFGSDENQIEPKQAPSNMLLAMAMAGGLCILFGVWPSILYAYLPFEMDWQPYTASHLVEMTQLLLFTFFAFYIFIPKLHAQATISVDTDVFYRKSAPLFRAVFVHGVSNFFDAALALAHRIAAAATKSLEDPVQFVPGNLPRLPGDEVGFDEDRARRPVGVSIGLTLLALLVLAVWALGFSS